MRNYLKENSGKVFLNADIRKSNADKRKFIFGGICNHLREICENLRLNCFFQKSLNNKKGNILVFSYVVVAILLILGGTFVSQAFTEMRTAQVFEKTAQAFQAAEAMVQDSYWRLDHGKKLVRNISLTSAANPNYMVNAAVNNVVETLTTKEITAIGSSIGSFGTNLKTIEQTVINKKGFNVFNANRNLEFVYYDQNGNGALDAGENVAGTLIVNGRVVLSGTMLYTNPNAIAAIDILRTAVNLLETQIIFPDPPPTRDGAISSSEFVAYSDSVVSRIQARNPNEAQVIRVVGNGVIVINTGTLLPQTKLVFIRDGSGGPINNKVILVGSINRDLTFISNCEVRNSLVGSQNTGEEDQPLLAVMCYGDFIQSSAPMADPRLGYALSVTSFGNAIFEGSMVLSATVSTQNNIKIRFINSGDVINLTLRDFSKGVPLGLNEPVEPGSLISPFAVEFEDEGVPEYAFVWPERNPDGNGGILWNNYSWKEDVPISSTGHGHSTGAGQQNTPAFGGENS